MTTTRMAWKFDRTPVVVLTVTMWSISTATTWAAPPAGPPRGDAIEVAPVWAGHPVGFSLLTVKDRQYVAFFAADRRLTVASRALDERTWDLKRLPSAQEGPPTAAGQTSAILGWDSHNAVVMAVDTSGQLHLAGNMHDTGLTYYRTRQPGKIGSIEQIPQMIGRDEDRCTYPLFLTLADTTLVFRYRSGKSGDGDWFANAYETASQSWRRLVELPLFDGEGVRNAYPLTPIRGPDGLYHVSWVWRERPADCSMNHDLCYARSRDLVHWETAGGERLTLPITLATPGVVVDAVPVRSGLLNGTGRIGFDSQHRPVIAYGKDDAAGNYQAYVARWRDGVWSIQQLTTWNHRWELEGRGTLPVYEVRLGAVRVGEPGTLRLDFGHVKAGSGEWVIDEASLMIVKLEPPRNTLPRGFWKVRGATPGLAVRTAEDSGEHRGTARFMLRWETLPPNRDRPRDPPWPEPSMLEVWELHDHEAADSKPIK